MKSIFGIDIQAWSPCSQPVMHSLGLLLLFCMALDSSNQEEIISLEDRIKAHLNGDPTTKQILAGIYNRPEFVTPPI